MKSHLQLIILIFLGTYFTKVSSQTKYNYINKAVSFGMREVDNRKIDVIIVHSTFNNSGGDKYDIDLILRQFSRYGVSSHFVIGRKGEIFLLVNEKNIAFHAGKGVLPDGRSNINSCSIGIELMTSFDKAPSEEQVNSLIYLVNDFKSRYQIKYILRHSDIAPDRKTDPWNMNWDSFLTRLNEKEQVKQ